MRDAADSELTTLLALAQRAQDVAARVDRADRLDDLADAAGRVDALLAALAGIGLQVERIARIACALNRRLIARAWSMLAPQALAGSSCLLVMGSEGRGEQILKTDQDNALILPDGLSLPPAEVAAAVAALSDALARMGWPPCPGAIMVTNPRWCADVSAWRATIRDWVHGGQTEGPMHLAIFFDAAAVAGDASLLTALNEHLARVVCGGDAFLARFAAAADQFEAPASWWQRLTGSQDEQPLDLKKLGTFPIVHGVRALSLAHGVRAADTVQRLRALVAREALDARLGDDLVEALHYLMGLRLRRQLAQREAGTPPDNLARPSDLSTMERDQLRDAIAITRRLREHLRARFRLDSV
jgi:CBS domain-containing protein